MDWNIYDKTRNFRSQDEYFLKVSKCKACQDESKQNQDVEGFHVAEYGWMLKTDYKREDEITFADFN